MLSFVKIVLLTLQRKIVSWSCYCFMLHTLSASSARDVLAHKLSILIALKQKTNKVYTCCCCAGHLFTIISWVLAQGGYFASTGYLSSRRPCTKSPPTFCFTSVCKSIYYILQVFS